MYPMFAKPTASLFIQKGCPSFCENHCKLQNMILEDKFLFKMILTEMSKSTKQKHAKWF